MAKKSSAKQNKSAKAAAAAAGDRSDEANDISFEDSLAELQKIVVDLEQGQLGLDDSLSQYEQGVAHLKRCLQLLSDAERKIELLRGVDEDGNVIADPFGDSAAESGDSLEAKAKSRSRRRGAGSSRGGSSTDAAGGEFSDHDNVDAEEDVF